MNEENLSCCIAQAGDDVVLSILVQPRASKNALCGVQGTELKVRLTSPPVEGAANKMCCAFFAKLFGCAKSHVSLERGQTSRHKQIRVANMNAAEIRRQVLEQLA